MRQSVFPDPNTYDFPEWVEIGEYLYRADDVVAFGTPLTVENIREAYRKGIFPWYTEGVPLPWHCPEQRAILEFSDLRVPRSLEKERRKCEFTFTIDRAFRDVIHQCSLAYRPGQGGTWITPEFERVYTEAHKIGFAHSVEAWDADATLVGGLYGIDAGGVFCGESMFYKQPNASKLALLFLIDHLKQRGSTWLDCQVMTPHMKALGAKEIPRNQFLDRLQTTKELRLPIFDKYMILPHYQDAIVRRVEQIVRMLAEKKYDRLAEASNGVRISADQIGEAIAAYPGRIVMPPDITYDLCDVIEVENSTPKRWSVNFDLWTEEEGKSDLTLELTLVDTGNDDLDFEIDNIHVR